MSDDVPKLRIKPRLAAESPTSPPPGPPVADAATSPPPLPPTGAPPDFRLKPKVPVPQAGLVNVPLASTEGTAPSPFVAPSPRRSSEELAAEGRKVQFAALLIGALGLTLFAGVGYLAYSGQFNAVHAFAPEERLELPGEEDGEPTKDSRPDVVAAPAQAETPKTADAAAPALETAPSRPAEVSTSADVVPTPSLEFRTYVANLRILGVRAGSNPRVLIDRTSYTLGATINEELGIIFAGYDSERHLVRFQDATGAFVERPDR